MRRLKHDKISPYLLFPSANQREKKSAYMRAMTPGSTPEGNFFPQECVFSALQCLKQMDSSVTEYLLVLQEVALLRPPFGKELQNTVSFIG